MKKTLIVAIVVILLGISIYTVNTYNSSTYKNKVSQENVESTTKKQSKSNNALNQPIDVNPKVFKTKAIDFKLKDLDGKEFSLSELKGKKVFLNFWATWCPPCRGEMPEIEKLYQETKDSDLVIVTIDLGEPLDTVKSFINNNKYNFKVLLDSDQSVSSKYGISSLPTSYFIDVNGNIVAKNLGAMNLEQMKEYIKMLDK